VAKQTELLFEFDVLDAEVIFGDEQDTTGQEGDVDDVDPMVLQLTEGLCQRR
jgi:hypothetical protein